MLPTRKFNFDVLHIKKNNKITKRGYSLVQYDGQSVQIMLNFGNEDPTNNIHKKELQATPVLIPKKNNENARVSTTTTPSRKEQIKNHIVVNHKPFRSTIENENHDPVSFENGKSKERKEALSCGCLCKLPKVTSASAISPPHLSHQCQRDGVPSMYIKTTSKNNEISRSSRNTFPTKLQIGSLDNSLISTSCHNTPISSLSQDFRHRFSNGQNIYKQPPRAIKYFSEADTNKQINSDPKSQTEKEKIQQPFNSYLFFGHSVLKPSKAKNKVKLRNPNCTWTRVCTQYLYSTFKVPDALNINDLTRNLQLNILIDHRISLRWLTQTLNPPTKGNEIIKYTKPKKNLCFLNPAKKSIVNPKDIFNQSELYTHASATTEALIDTAHLYDDSFNPASYDSTFLTPSLTTRSYIGNRRVQSYIQLHPKNQNIFDIVKELRNESQISYCNKNVSKLNTQKWQALGDKPQKDPISYTNNVVANKSVSPCCLFYSHECDCKIRYRKYSTNMNG